MSGLASSSQRNRTGSRPLMPFTLKVAIFMPAAYARPPPFTISDKRFVTFKSALAAGRRRFRARDMVANTKLSAYRAKRDFTVTKEPSGEATPRPGTRLRFVVQKHAATR